MIANQNLVFPGRAGFGSLAFDGTGLLGTGLFCWPPDGVSCTWSWGEGIFAVLGLYMLWSTMRVTKVGVRRGRKAAGAARAAFAGD